jgi:hypothetical protein
MLGSGVSDDDTLGKGVSDTLGSGVSDSDTLGKGVRVGRMSVAQSRISSVGQSVGRMSVMPTRG